MGLLLFVIKENFCHRISGTVFYLATHDIENSRTIIGKRWSRILHPWHKVLCLVIVVRTLMLVTDSGVYDDMM